MTLIAAHGTHYISRDQLAALPAPEPQGPRHYVRPFIEDVETVLDHFSSIGARLVGGCECQQPQAIWRCRT